MAETHPAIELAAAWKARAEKAEALLERELAHHEIGCSCAYCRAARERRRLADAPGGERAQDEPCAEDCMYCSGETCAFHGAAECDCDTMERHDASPRPAEPEPPKAEQEPFAPDEMREMADYYTGIVQTLGAHPGSRMDRLAAMLRYVASREARASSPDLRALVEKWRVMAAENPYGLGARAVGDCADELAAILTQTGERT